MTDAAEPSDDERPDDDLPDEVIAKVSDYLDGALVGGERDDVASKIANDPLWQRAYAEISDTRKYLSGLRKAAAPSSFAQDVTETIHQRSAGRFFGRRSLGDRVPLGAVLVVALAVLVVVGYVLWSSTTGSLKRDDDPARVTPGSADHIDHP